MLLGRYRRLRDVPEYRLINGVLPFGKPRPARVKLFNDRGLVSVAVQAYANVKGLEYEEAHGVLSS